MKLHGASLSGAYFADFADAGRRLGRTIDPTALHEPLVLGLARGGVPVAEQVARALDAPLDVLVVRKVGLPGHPGLATSPHKTSVLPSTTAPIPNSG